MNETCDYDTGTAFSGPAKCGRTARFLEQVEALAEVVKTWDQEADR